MLYFLLIHQDEARMLAQSDDENERMLAGYRALQEATQEAGVYVGSHRLRPTTSATTVRVRDGRMLCTDGPFAETKEQFGGYVLVDVPSLDEAIEWARRIPGASDGCVEVRPVWVMDEGCAANPVETSEAKKS